MKKHNARLPIALAVMFAVVLFTGCSKFPGFAPKTSTPASERKYSTVTFENATGETLYFLYISEKTDSGWGEDWLGENVILNDETYTTRLLTGEYDVKAADLTEENTWTFWVRVNEGGGSVSIDPSDKD